MINFRHLRSFWAVARFGGVSRASEKIGLSPQTLSGQVAELQLELGVELLRQAGRRLELTEAGRLAYSHAEEIFALAEALATQVRAMPAGRARLFRLGMTDAVPRSLAYRLLAPLVADPALRLTASHERLEVLVADLALHRLDLVIADRPVPPGSAVKVFNHVLGDTPIALFAEPALAARLRAAFPAALEGAPVLLPGRDSVLHGDLLGWFEARRLNVRVVGEFDDGGLMKAFGASGAGAFAAPLAVRAEIERLYGVALVAPLEAVKERYYAISTERRATDPQVLKVLALAEAVLGGDAGPAPKQDRPAPGVRARRRART
jgi:LysR family transcriptional activator of nhaA